MTVAEFNSSVDLYADNLYRFILKNIRDKDKAKDIVQDTYEKLWLKVSDIASTNAKSYMFTTAYRTMLDAIRKDKKTESIDQVYEVSTNKNPEIDLKKTIEEALEKLPEVQKNVILLRDYEGYNYQEIGEITGLTESQVKVYIYRARVSMKDYLVSLHHLI
jgi:RNA polymerase sigma-70 factor (ECF subfamily)